MVSMGVFVPASILFPDADSSFATFRSLLQGLSRTDVLFWCARLNHVLAGTTGLTHEQRQAFGLRQFSTTGQLRRLDEYCKQHNRSTSDVTIFFRGQVLELLRWAALYGDDHADDGTTFESPATRQDFLHACLLASEYWGERVYGNALDLADGLAAARQRALGPLRLAMEAKKWPLRGLH